MSSFFTPYIPNIPAYMLRNDIMTNAVNTLGISLMWRKSHSCACTYGGPASGTPSPTCNTCNGIGIYWDHPGVQFTGVVNFLHARGSSVDEPGTVMDSSMGLLQTGTPILTIPSNATTVWNEANIYDAYVEVDTLARYSSYLQVGGNTVLPYQDNLSVASQGAVAVWDTSTQSTTFVNSYTVSGSNVLLNGYPEGTWYVVEFYACPVYIAFNKSGGFVHQRPFGAANNPFPKRFKLAMLDLWVRSQKSTPFNTGPSA